MKKFLPIIFLCLMGCASTYHREGFFGDGYSEIITNRDTYLITYKGNEYTSPETALRFALLRASELTMTNGYNYFVVVSSTDRSSSYNYTTTRTEASASANAETKSKSTKAKAGESISTTTYSGVVTKPATSVTIKCFMDKPDSDDFIDARFFWQTNHPNLSS